MPSPHTHAPSTTTGTDTALIIALAIWVTALMFGALTWLTGNITNALYGSGPWTHFATLDAALHPGQIWPHLSATAVLIGSRIIPSLLTAGLATTGYVLWLRLRGGTTTGLARKTDLAPLLGKEIADKARNLRPSLNERECKRGRAR